MKKIFALLLALIFVFALCACGDSTETDASSQTDSSDNQTTSVESSGDTSSENESSDTTTSSNGSSGGSSQSGTGSNSEPSNNSSTDSNSTTEFEVYGTKPISSRIVLEVKDENGKLILTNSDISQLRACYSDDLGFFLEVTFTESGAVKFADGVRANDGKKMSVLVDGQVVVEPIVPTEFSSNPVAITVSTHKELMDAFDMFTK